MNPSLAIPPFPAAPSSLAEAVKAWYCVRVMARREHIAAMNLTQRTGLPVFSPRIKVQKKSAQPEPRFSTEALFPGYLFARFNYSIDARYVTSTPGVLGLVSFGGTPPVIADRVIDQLTAEVSRTVAAPAAPLFEEGSWVRIIAGCFQGSEGRVLQVSSTSTRISVLLNLLGQEIQVSMPGSQLAGTDDSRGKFPAGLHAIDDLAGNRR